MKDLSNAKVGGEFAPYFDTLIHQKVVKHDTFDDIPNDVYHNQIEGLSSSSLKNCTTPIGYKTTLDNPRKYNKMAMTVGTAAHALILEPDTFDYRCFDEEQILNQVQSLRPDTDRKNLRKVKEYKDKISEYKGEDGEFLDDVISLETYNSLFKIKARIEQNPIIVNLLKGKAEQSIFAAYENGLSVKIRPDMLKVADSVDVENLKLYGVKEGDLINLSVKTTVDGSPRDFYRACMKLDYDLAEAFYQDVLKSVYSVNIHTFYLVCEKDSDNIFTSNVMLYHNSEKHIAGGRAKYKANLEVYWHCYTTGDYSMGYEFFNDGSILMDI